MILLVLVAMLWVAVLAPSAWRRFNERQGVGSIDHFHHQLQLLEHAGPKTVSPAYRLHTAPAEAYAEVQGEEDAGAVAVDSSRPKLVLLRPTDDAWAADLDDEQGGHYERIQVLDMPEPVCLPADSADLRAMRRTQARRRCTMLLRCLVGVAISTALVGILPGMHMVWLFSGIAGVALAGLLGLMAYAREIEAEQARQRDRRVALRPEVQAAWPEPESEVIAVRPAVVGTVAVGASWTRGQARAPGWDDVWKDDAEDFELPRVVAR